MRIALLGQPNSGKSTIFNSVAGYKSVTSNFPGKTVEYTKTRVNFRGTYFELVDLPGTYSLTSFDLAELEARNYILSGEVDVVVNVVDASLLSRGLELTLQLLELEIPSILVLNMIDDAKRKGIYIYKEKLEEILGIPVVETVAVKGIGLKDVFRTAIETGEKKEKPKPLKYRKDVETVIQNLYDLLPKELEKLNLPKRFLTVKLLEKDTYIIKKVLEVVPYFKEEIEKYQKILEETHGKPSDMVIAGERHALSMDIFEKVTQVKKPSFDLVEKIDNIMLHKYLGYPILALVLYFYFNFIFKIGVFLEEPIMGIFDKIDLFFVSKLGHSLWASVLEGVIQGFSGGVGIVIPYLVPFLIGLSFLEDIGYLPRVAFLMDVFMHKIGLHGKAIIPFILGYGCNVPAIMATRILEEPRDRFITGFLATFIPCSARITIIYGLVAYFISPQAALFIFFFNILVIAFIGKILNKILPFSSPGMILEIPKYHMPSLKVVLAKTWLRMKDFIYIAWPLLIAGSLVLSLLQYYKLDLVINKLLRPLTVWILGIPEFVGTTLIFGVLRKELSMIMLIQAAGTSELSKVMTPHQIFIFTIFVVFYIPCIATIAVLHREFGLKKVTIITLSTILVASLLGFLFRLWFLFF